jgi:hypothetical protein
LDVRGVAVAETRETHVVEDVDPERGERVAGGARPRFAPRCPDQVATRHVGDGIVDGRDERRIDVVVRDPTARAFA